MTGAAFLGSNIIEYNSEAPIEIMYISNFSQETIFFVAKKCSDVTAFTRAFVDKSVVFII